MARVEAHSGVAWQDEADLVLGLLVRRQPEITADDLWKAGLSRPHDGRALGTVVMRAVRDSLLADTGRSTRSTLAVRHRRPLTVWKSLVYRQSG